MFCCIVRSTAHYYYTNAIDVWLMVLRKTSTIDPSRIHLFDVWLMGVCLSFPVWHNRVVAYSSVVTRDVWLMILYRPRRCIWLTIVTVSVWLMGWMLTGVDFLFVRRLWDVISNESILVLKENKHNFYSIQHIFIQWTYFNIQSPTKVSIF